MELLGQTGHRGSCDARATTNPAAEPDGAAAQERPAMRAAQIEQNVAAHELLGTGPVAKPSLGARSSDQSSTIRVSLVVTIRNLRREGCWTRL